MQTVVNSALGDIWILVWVDLMIRRLRCRSLLAEQLDVLLRCVAGFFDLLCCFSDTRVDLVGLGFNLFVQTLENWEDGAMEVLLGLNVRVGEGLQSLLAL